MNFKNVDEAYEYSKENKYSKIIQHTKNKLQILNFKLCIY